MTGKETYILLSKIFSKTIENKTLDSYIEIIIREEIPVFCKNKLTNKARKMPFKHLFDNNEKFWEQKGNWEYYFLKEDYNKILEIINKKSSGINIEFPVKSNENESSPPIPAEVGFGNEYEIIQELPVAEKIELINSNKQKLDSLADSKEKEKVTEALVDAVNDAALVNRAILEEAMQLGDNEAKKLTQNLVDTTHEMVKSSCALITEDIFNSDLMNTLVQKSNGTIVQHMTRSYLNGIAFLVYFNNLISASSLAQKIRISFTEKYRKYYHSLLPYLHIDDIVPERVFSGSLRSIPPELLHNWAVGFLVHDIGKAAAVEYHEGEEKYDRNIVIEHVKLGYKYVLTKTNYPMEANMIIGYHHEYYGDPAGYGYFRAYLSQYKKQNPAAKMDYCISYEKESVLDYKAFAYFPAKVLEIIDVFDSVTDPNRIYRKPMTPEEAIKMMREEFIEKQLKIDPIIFDIFSVYIEERHYQSRQITNTNEEKSRPTKEELFKELERNANILNEIMKNRHKK